MNISYFSAIRQLLAQAAYHHARGEIATAESLMSVAECLLREIRPVPGDWEAA